MTSSPTSQLSSHHCPYCNGKNNVAIGPVAYANSVLIEHRCASCGHLFCITDRRLSKQREENLQRAAQALRMLMQRTQSRRAVN